MLKILQARLQQDASYQMFKLNLEKAEEKAEEPEIKIANIRWIIKKAKEFQKNIYFCFIDCAKAFVDYAKAFDCVDHKKLWKFFKRWEYQTT